MQYNNTTGYKGVHKLKVNGKFTASIRRAGKSCHLGCFSTAKEAAKAYDRAARETFGKFAKLNFTVGG